MIDALLQRIYAAGQSNDAAASDRAQMMLNITPSTGQFLDVLPSGPLSAPVALAFGYDGNLYVSNHEFPNSRVTRLNGETGAFIDDFVPAGTPGLISATGILFYVPEPNSLIAAFVLSCMGLIGFTARRRVKL